MINKFTFALVFFICGFVVAFFLKRPLEPDSKTQRKLSSVATCKQFTLSELLVKMIEDDFADLRIRNQLPHEWGSISRVEVHNNSNLGKALLSQDSPHFNVKPDGSSYLEIEIIDLPDDRNPGIILQASLFDLYSKNKIFEIGRTYFLNDTQKK